MASLGDVSSWRSLGAHLYRTIPVYDSFKLPDVETFDDFVVCAAPFGGPIAITGDRSKLTMLRSSGPAAHGALTVFTAAGALLGMTRLEERSARLLGMFWTASEVLACIFEDGSVDLYDPLASLLPKSFSLLPSAASHDRIEMYACCAGGMAAVVRRSDGSGGLVAVYDWADPIPVHLSALRSAFGAGGGGPTCIACLDGAFSADGRMEVLLGTAERSIVTIDSEDRATDQQLDSVLTSVVRMLAISPSGRYLAAFGEDGSVTVTDTTFERKLTEFDTRASSRPTQLLWCGEDAVVVAWPERGVLVIGPSGDYLSFVRSGDGVAAVEPGDGDLEGGSEEPLHVVQEGDGVRMLSAHSHTLLQRVPPSIQNIRSIGSTAPAATLVNAAAKFEAADADCDELLRTLLAEDTLKEAVAECIGAATHEWETGAQQHLLRCASYGKSFDPDFDSAVFVEACKRLRLLNALRAFGAGLPLTAHQFDTLTAPVVVDRLCARHAYRLALQVCDYLGLPKDRVLVHWACAKVRGSSGQSDEDIRDRIRRNLAGVAGVSYADIAAAADSAGRRKLATMLLGFEPRLADQVPILLKMREGRLALERAIASGDTDLVYLALLHLQRQYQSSAATAAVGGAGDGGSAGESEVDGGGPGQAAFLRVVQAYPAAVDLLAAYYRDRQSDPGMLVRLLQACGRCSDAGHALLASAALVSPRSGGATLERHLSLLQRAVNVFRDGEKTAPAGAAGAAERAACAFYRSATEEQAQLLLLQGDLDRDVEGGEGSFVGLSLADTVHRLVTAGEQKRAQMLRDTFRMSDAAWTHVRIAALAEARDWLALQRLADERRGGPVVGFTPLVDACLEHDAVVEARKYAGRIPEFTERFKALVACGAIVEAAEAATKARDAERLQSLVPLARSLPAARAVIEEGLSLMGR